MVTVQRFEVWLINLDLTQDSEINKTRQDPSLLDAFPNEMNCYLRTVTITALTSTQRDSSSWVGYSFQGRRGKWCSTIFGPWAKPGWCAA